MRGKVRAGTGSSMTDDKQIGEFEKDGTYSFKAGNAVSDKLFTIKFETERGSSFTLWSTCLE